MSRYSEATKDLDRMSNSVYLSRRDSSPQRANGKGMDSSPNRSSSYNASRSSRLGNKYNDDDEEFYNMRSSALSKSHLSTSYSSAGGEKHGSALFEDSYLTRNMPNRSKVDDSGLNSTSYSKSRQFSHLDHVKPPVVEYTSYNNYVSSKQKYTTNTNNTQQNATTTNNIEDPSRQPSAASVINTFRDLQNQIKKMEQEKYDILQQRDALKVELYESKRHHKSIIHKNEVTFTENLIGLKSKQDGLNSEYNALQYQFNNQQELNHSLEHQVSSLEYYYHSLQKDINYDRNKQSQMEQEITLLHEQSVTTQIRTHDLDHMVTNTSPKKFSKHESLLSNQLCQLEAKYEHIKQQKVERKHKLKALERYMELIIKINQDLCDTLLSRERLKEKLFKLSGSTNLRSVSPSPRYAWPKEIPYHNILNVINDAAQVQATAVMENTAIQATNQAIQTVIGALSPHRSSRSPARSSRSKSPASVSSSRSHRRSRSASASRSVSRSRYTDNDDEEEDEEEEITNSLHRLSLDHQNHHNSNSNNNHMNASNGSTSSDPWTPRRSIHFEDESSSATRRSGTNTPNSTNSNSNSQYAIKKKGILKEALERSGGSSSNSHHHHHHHHSEDDSEGENSDEEDENEDEEEDGDHMLPTSSTDDDDQEQEEAEELDLGESMHPDELHTTYNDYQYQNATKKKTKRNSTSANKKSKKTKKADVKALARASIGNILTSMATGLLQSAAANSISNINSRGRSRSVSRSRGSGNATGANTATSSATVRSRKLGAFDKVIARQGAITSATRLAAAANAASITTKLHTTPSPLRSSHYPSTAGVGLSQLTGVSTIQPTSTLLQPTISSFLSSSSVHPMTTRARSQSTGPMNRINNNNNYNEEGIHNQKLPATKLSFIPSSGTRSAEFNIVASVSKASRAAKSLNATLASK